MRIKETTGLISIPKWTNSVHEYCEEDWGTRLNILFKGKDPDLDEYDFDDSG